MQAEVILPLAALVSETAAGDRQRGLADAIASAQRHRKTVQDTHGLHVLARPAQQARPPSTTGAPAQGAAPRARTGRSTARTALARRAKRLSSGRCGNRSP